MASSRLALGLLWISGAGASGPALAVLLLSLELLPFFAIAFLALLSIFV